MAVQPVTQSNSAYVTKATASPDQIDNPKAAMGKNDFLNMFIKKLENQDPTSPVDDASFTADMAQFSSLEQMQNLNTTATDQATSLANLNTNIVGLMAMQNTTQAAGLIGKTVTVSTVIPATDGSGNTTAGPDASGTVSVVKFVNGQPVITVNGVDYQLSSIKSISA
jgi:flagellar basal-body rod modification protein FlgD